MGLRNLTVDLVLATDMAQNKAIITAFQEIRDAASSGGSTTVDPFVASSPANAMTILQMGLKCADMGHLALGWSLHMQWVRRLEAEFFTQGDQEKEMEFPEISFLMDREKPGVTETQVGFFNFVVFPLFRPFVETFPLASPVMSAVEENFGRWREIEA